MKIYLAGPEVFERDAIARGKELKGVCAGFGVEGLFPLDNELEAEPGLATRIREGNMAMIRECDAIVANMTPFRGPSMDAGTAYEMGVGAGLGKIVVGYTLDPRPYVDKVRAFVGFEMERGDDGWLRDAQGLLVEEFLHLGKGLVDNLMIACGVECLCDSVEEAIRAATELFKAREADNSSNVH
jgi:nucleoside 2-deoxyribosyltransferase